MPSGEFWEAHITIFTTTPTLASDLASRDPTLAPGIPLPLLAWRLTFWKLLVITALVLVDSDGHEHDRADHGGHARVWSDREESMIEWSIMTTARAWSRMLDYRGLYWPHRVETIHSPGFHIFKYQNYVSPDRGPISNSINSFCQQQNDHILQDACCYTLLHNNTGLVIITLSSTLFISLISPLFSKQLFDKFLRLILNQSKPCFREH